MRAVIQRVKESAATVDGAVVGAIGPGLMTLLGVAADDVPADADYLAQKIVNLRIFEDENGKMNRSLLDAGGELLVISQFTLLGDCRKGRRPSFTGAAPPEAAKRLYERFIQKTRDKGVRTARSRFGAMMAVSLINDGPVTLILESR